MSTTEVSERQIVEALHGVPTERWGQVLSFLNSLQITGPAETEEERPIRTLGDLLGSGLVGMWAGRTDIGDSRAYARQLRHQASHRHIQGKADVAGH